MDDRRNVIALVPLTETYCEDIVRHLEGYLADARKGKYKMIAVCTVTQGNDCEHSISMGAEPLLLLGGIARLTHTLNQCIDSTMAPQPFDDDDNA